MWPLKARVHRLALPEWLSATLTGMAEDSPTPPLSPDSMGEVADQLAEAYNALDWEACEERYKAARQREMGAAIQAGGEGEQQLQDLLRDPAAASPRQGGGRRKEEEGCCTIS